MKSNTANPNRTVADAAAARIAQKANRMKTYTKREKKAIKRFDKTSNGLNKI